MSTNTTRSVAHLKTVLSRLASNLSCRVNGLVAMALVVALVDTPAGAQDPFANLMTLSLEDLMVVQVSLAARSEQPLSETAAAVHILTRDDIRRSGATSVAELLRQVPGVQVARIDANKWAITARGFNERFANKLLVQVDGRTVYTPAFSGVYWEELDVVLADVERIEVIRGPGAALWGANAVNGVINIVTQHARDTQGTLVEFLAGTEDRVQLSLRHGGSWGQNRQYRVYTKVTNRDAAIDTSGRDAGDEWSMIRAGGRLDWQHERLGDLHLQAEGVFGDLSNQVRLPRLDESSFEQRPDPIEVVGGHVLGRWHLGVDTQDSWTAQWFYNLQDREEFSRQRIQTLDVDLQNLRQFSRHELVWGGGFRVTWDHLSSGLAIRIDDPKTTQRQIGLFVQDDIALAGDHLHLILGTKLEHNGFTGSELQPTARLRYTHSERLTVWTSASRAVRTPSRGERGVRVVLPGSGLPAAFLPEGVAAGFAGLSGGMDLDSERLHALEAGIRGLAFPWLLVDITGFLHEYDDLRSLTTGSTYIDSSLSQPTLFLPISFSNGMDGTSHGVEAVADIRIGLDTRFALHYSYIDIDLTDPADTSAELEEGGSPTHQLRLSGAHDIGDRWMINAVVRFVDELPALGIKSYTTADLRLGYRLTDDCELELSVRNALTADHQEYAPVSLHSDPALVERSLHAGLRWRR